MKYNYIFNAIDTEKVTKELPKTLSITSQKVKKIKSKKQRKPRVRQIIRSYKTYMESDLWIRRKNRYFSKYGKKCEACGKPKYVTLHHAVYRNNYGDEPDEEVFALCGRCHNQFHENFGVSKDMLENTKLFIEEVKNNKSLLIEDYKQTEWLKTI